MSTKVLNLRRVKDIPTFSFSKIPSTVVNEANKVCEVLDSPLAWTNQETIN